MSINTLNKVNNTLLAFYKSLNDYVTQDSYHNGLTIVSVEDVKDAIKLLENYKKNLESDKRKLEDNPNYWSSRR